MDTDFKKSSSTVCGPDISTSIGRRSPDKIYHHEKLETFPHRGKTKIFQLFLRPHVRIRVFSSAIDKNSIAVERRFFGVGWDWN